MLTEVTVCCCGQDAVYHPSDGSATCMVCGAHFSIAVLETTEMDRGDKREGG